MNIGHMITTGVEHAHAEHGFWEEFLALLSDPAHLAFELVFSLVFDILIVTILYGIIIKKIIIPRLRKSIHEEIDREHGVEHQ